MSDSEYINRVSYMVPDGTVRTVTYAELIERDALTRRHSPPNPWREPCPTNTR